MTEPDKLLNQKQVATLLNVSPMTVKRMSEIGKIKRIQLAGRTVRYRESEVMRIISGELSV